MPKTQRPDVGGVGPKLEKRFIQRQPQSSSKAESPKQAADRSLVAGPCLELFTRQRRPGRDCWGNEIDKFEYKPRDDFSRSIAECYRVIRERVAAGGRPWVRHQPEAILQRSLIEHLRWGARGDAWWTHLPNGGWRSPVEAAIFKSLGVRAGSPDLLIIRAGQPLFVELKAPAHKLSPAQVECHDALRRAGATVETAENIDTAIAFLARVGVMR